MYIWEVMGNFTTEITTSLKLSKIKSQYELN